MISRKIEKELQRFHDSDEKKALLITGARQVGKTFIIREFGKWCKLGYRGIGERGGERQ